MKCTITLIAGVLAGLALTFVRGNDEEGFTPLFDGKTFSGWVNVNCSPATWSVRDGVIAATGVPTGILRSERQYENFILIADWRLKGKAGNDELPVSVRGGFTPELKAGALPDKWNRCIITVKGDRLTAVLNDKTVIENAPQAGLRPRGPVSLRPAGGATQFANLYIKKLD